jgi:hypothetical protein
MNSHLDRTTSACPTGRRAATVLIVMICAAFTPDMHAAELASGLQGPIGTTIGPGGALFVAETAGGRISRIDPQSGEVSTFASGLPTSAIGGPIDLTFIGRTAYVLVTLVGPELGGPAEDVVGIYRIDGPDTFEVIADLGSFSASNPPDTAYFIATGVQYAIDRLGDGFVVTDGHHNRVLRVGLDGSMSVLASFDNIVPTGIAVSGDTVYMAEAGPIPHLPDDGKVVAFDTRGGAVDEVASGARLVVDVAFGRGRTLYALSQGFWSGGPEGSPADPDTGSLVRVNDDGTFTPLIENIDRPTSMEFIGNTVYVVTLGGDVLRYDDVSAPPFGEARGR